jgi:hypothetical protein
MPPLRGVTPLWPNACDNSRLAHNGEMRGFSVSPALLAGRVLPRFRQGLFTNAALSKYHLMTPPKLGPRTG